MRLIPKPSKLPTANVLLSTAAMESYILEVFMDLCNVKKNQFNIK